MYETWTCSSLSLQPAPFNNYRPLAGTVLTSRMCRIFHSVFVNQFEQNDADQRTLFKTSKEISWDITVLWGLMICGNIRNHFPCCVMDWLSYVHKCKVEIHSLNKLYLEISSVSSSFVCDTLKQTEIGQENKILIYQVCITDVHIASFTMSLTFMHTPFVIKEWVVYEGG